MGLLTGKCKYARWKPQKGFHFDGATDERDGKLAHQGDGRHSKPGEQNLGRAENHPDWKTEIIAPTSPPPASRKHTWSGRRHALGKIAKAVARRRADAYPRHLRGETTISSPIPARSSLARC